MSLINPWGRKPPEYRYDAEPQPIHYWALPDATTAHYVTLANMDDAALRISVGLSAQIDAQRQTNALIRRLIDESKSA